MEILEVNRIFQQDNDLKHNSKKAKQWFEGNDIQVLAWPAQSPDINPIVTINCLLGQTLTQTAGLGLDSASRNTVLSVPIVLGREIGYQPNSCHK